MRKYLPRESRSPGFPAEGIFKVVLRAAGSGLRLVDEDFTRFAVDEIVRMGLIDSPADVMDSHVERVKIYFSGSASAAGGRRSYNHGRAGRPRDRAGLGRPARQGPVDRRYRKGYLLQDDTRPEEPGGGDVPDRITEAR